MSTYDEAMKEWLLAEPVAEDFEDECDACDDAEWDGPDDTGLKLECLRIAVSAYSASDRADFSQIIGLADEFYEFVAS